MDQSKVRTIPNILQKYRGQETKLLASLAKKYPQAAHLRGGGGGKGGGGRGGGMGGGGGGFGGGAQRKLGFTTTPSPQRGGFGGGMGGNTSFGNKNPGFGGNSFSQARK